MKKIRLFKPSVGMEELNNIKSVFKKSWLGYGPLVKNFEEKFAKFICNTSIAICKEPK